MLEQLFYEFLDKICQETARPKYQLSDLSLSQMRWLCQNCELLILKERDLEQDRISVPLHTCTGELFQNLKVLPFPMTLQHLPLYEQEQPVLPKPKVILIDAPRYQPFQESILFHEICHLFSIGTLEQQYYCFPKGAGDIVAKTRLAAEELYKLKKSKLL